MQEDFRCFQIYYAQSYAVLIFKLIYPVLIILMLYKVPKCERLEEQKRFKSRAGTKEADMTLNCDSPDVFL